jgi:iron complex transport system substrate-binding protein
MMTAILAVLCASPLSARTIIDAGGQKVVVNKPFSRIISLYPAHTENLFSLGLDQEIIGVYKSDDFPDRVNDKKKYSYREDAEKFIAARPDLVLIRPMIARGYANLVAQLQKAGITVVSLQPRSVAEMYDYWRTLGILTGRQTRAESMITGFKEQLAAMAAAVKKIPAEARKRVYFEAIHGKMKTFAPTSMAIFALESAGGVNVAIDAAQVRNTNIAAYGKERILARSSEIEVYLAQQGKMNRVDVQTIKDEPGFAAIKAVRQEQIYLIDEKLVSRPTMRLLEGIRRIGRILYPELFAAQQGWRPLISRPKSFNIFSAN